MPNIGYINRITPNKIEEYYTNPDHYVPIDGKDAQKIKVHDDQKYVKCGKIVKLHGRIWALGQTFKSLALIAACLTVIPCFFSSYRKSVKRLWREGLTREETKTSVYVLETLFPQMKKAEKLADLNQKILSCPLDLLEGCLLERATLYYESREELPGEPLIKARQDCELLCQLGAGNLKAQELKRKIISEFGLEDQSASPGVKELKENLLKSKADHIRSHIDSETPFQQAQKYSKLESLYLLFNDLEGRLSILNEKIETFKEQTNDTQWQGFLIRKI